MSRTIQKRQTKNKEILIEHLRKTPIIQMACEKAGVGRATYYRWKKEDEKFCEEADGAIEVSVGLMNDLAESQLLSAIRDRNMTAIIYWLKHRHKAYSTRIELSGSVKTDTGILTPEQKEMLNKAINNVFGRTERNG